MKTAAKFAALALIAVLAACVPEAELTDPDWGAFQSQINPGYSVDQLVGAAQVPYIPTVSAPGLSNVTRPNPVSNAYATITFHRAADILQVASGSIETELNRFLKFYSFTQNLTPTAFEVDTFGSEVAYTFVSRDAGVNGGGTITVKLGTLPTTGSIVAYIDPANYTFARGLKLNMDDPSLTFAQVSMLYTTLTITGNTGGATFVPPGDRRWTLNIAQPAGNLQSYTTNPPAQNNIPVASITINPIRAGATGAAQAAEDARGEILNLVKDRIILERYDSATKTWVNTNSTMTVNATAGTITTSYTVTDLTGYRVKATGMNNLESTGTYGGVKQKIRVSGQMLGSGSGDGYNRATVTSLPSFWYEQGGGRFNIGYVPASSVKVQSDINGKNVILWVRSPGFFTTGGTVQFNQQGYDIAEFNRHVKIAYNDDGSPVNATNMYDSNIEFIRVQSVEVLSSELTVTTLTNDELKITLDPNYTRTNTTKYLLISPGIALIGNSAYRYYDFDNWWTEIDGVSYFQFAGSFPTVF